MARSIRSGVIIDPPIPTFQHPKLNLRPEKSKSQDQERFTRPFNSKIAHKIFCQGRGLAQIVDVGNNRVLYSSN